MFIRILRAGWLLAVLLVFAIVGGSAAQSAPTPATCDQACLTKVMDGFIAAMTTGKPSSVPLAQDAEIRENTRVVTLDATAWKQVKTIRSIFTVADPVRSNVVSRAGVNWPASSRLDVC